MDDFKSELKEVKALLNSYFSKKKMDGSSQPKSTVPSFADIARQLAVTEKVIPPKLRGSGTPISSQVPVHRWAQIC